MNVDWQTGCRCSNRNIEGGGVFHPPFSVPISPYILFVVLCRMQNCRFCDACNLPSNFARNVEEIRKCKTLARKSGSSAGVTLEASRKSVSGIIYLVDSLLLLLYCTGDLAGMVASTAITVGREGHPLHYQQESEGNLNINQGRAACDSPRFVTNSSPAVS